MCRPGGEAGGAGAPEGAAEAQGGSQAPLLPAWVRPKQQPLFLGPLEGALRGPASRAAEAPGCTAWASAGESVSVCECV